MAEDSGIKAAVIFPPVVYGLGEGPVNKRSVQIPSLVQATVERGHAIMVGKGLSRWGNVHVRDLGKIIVSLAIEAASRRPDERVWGQDGLYLCGVGEMVSRKLYRFNSLPCIFFAPPIFVA